MEGPKQAPWNERTTGSENFFACGVFANDRSITPFQKRPNGRKPPGSMSGTQRPESSLDWPEIDGWSGTTDLVKAEEGPKDLPVSRHGHVQVIVPLWREMIEVGRALHDAP